MIKKKYLKINNFISNHHLHQKNNCNLIHKIDNLIEKNQFHVTSHQINIEHTKKKETLL